MSSGGFALFDTAIGKCGIAFGERGVRRVQLPGPHEADTRTRLMASAGDGLEIAPPPAIARATRQIMDLLRGEHVDLSAIALDLEGISPFCRRVYGAARRIPPGRTRSYGELAADLGAPGSARAVGQALGRNPFPIIVPCHRVVAAGGAGGFSAPFGVVTKLRLLEIEGVRAETTAPGKRAVSEARLPG